MILSIKVASAARLTHANYMSTMNWIVFCAIGSCGVVQSECEAWFGFKTFLEVGICTELIEQLAPRDIREVCFY
jgi:hypothetical protein